MFAERVGEGFDHDALLERLDDFNDQTSDLAQALAGDDELLGEPDDDDLADFARGMGMAGAGGRGMGAAPGVPSGGYGGYGAATPPGLVEPMPEAAATSGGAAAPVMLPSAGAAPPAPLRAAAAEKPRFKVA